LNVAEIAVAHEAPRRFVAKVDGREAVLEYTVIGTNTLDLYHTFVPPPLRGQGIASKLAEAALEYAAERGHTVAASCPFVARYIAAHPRYQPLLVADHRRE
jgi:hypothetical protein